MYTKPRSEPRSAFKCAQTMFIDNYDHETTHTSILLLHARYQLDFCAKTINRWWIMVTVCTVHSQLCCGHGTVCTFHGCTWPTNGNIRGTVGATECRSRSRSTCVEASPPSASPPSTSPPSMVDTCRTRSRSAFSCAKGDLDRHSVAPTDSLRSRLIAVAANYQMSPAITTRPRAAEALFLVDYLHLLF